MPSSYFDLIHLMLAYSAAMQGGGESISDKKCFDWGLWPLQQFHSPQMYNLNAACKI